jgi:hypothetical protein
VGVRVGNDDGLSRPSPCDCSLSTSLPTVMSETWLSGINTGLLEAVIPNKKTRGRNYSSVHFTYDAQRNATVLLR